MYPDTCGLENYCNWNVIRNEKVADTKISRYVWTGPQCAALPI